jgi:polysaccharide biosynthesis transport protein
MIIQMTRRNLAFILFKRWKTFAAVLLGTALLTAAYVLLVPRQYVSMASIFIRIDRENLADADFQQGATPAQPTNQNIATYIINSHVDMLESEDVARASLIKLGVNNIYPDISTHQTGLLTTPLDTAVDRLAHRDLSVQVDKDSNTLLLSLKNHNPVVAQRALQVLIATFIDAQERTLRDPRLGFTREQLDEAYAKLDQKQQAYLNYQRQEGIVSPAEERAQLLKQRNDIEEAIGETRAKIASDQNSKDELLRLVSSTKEQIPISNENDMVMHQMDDAHLKLATAEQRYLEASQTYSQDNPLLQDSKSEVELARQHYQQVLNSSTSRVRMGANPVYEELDKQFKLNDADLAARQAALDTWQSQLSGIQSRLDHLDVVEGKMDNLGLQVEVESANYKTYLARMEEARISDDLNRAGITNLSIVQTPSLPYAPTPKIPLIVALSVIVGLFGAVGLCFALELSDETMHSPASVEESIGLPVLATVSRGGLAKVRARHA